MKKKIISLLLTISMLGSLCSTVFAKEYDNEQNFSNLSEPIMQVASAKEAKDYNYVPHFEDSVTANDLRNLCTIKSIEEIGGKDYTIYTSPSIRNYLVDCEMITEILESDNLFYICYMTTTGNNIILSYSDGGLQSQTVYSQEKDCVFFFADDSALKYTLGHYSMSSATEKQIDDCLKRNDFEALSSIEGIQVQIDDKGNFSIEEKSQSQIPEVSVASISDPTTNSELLSSLQADFPMYTKNRMLATSKYCDALKKNIAIRVYESRNAYTKKTANWGTWGAGTAVTIIATALGFSTITPAIAILTGLGIGISTTDTILSQVSLCKSAHYKFTASRLGYAYDSTSYNNYVRVIDYTSTGGFAGGYDKNGDFTWIIDEPPSAFNHSYSQIADKTIYNYNVDVLMNNCCTLYYPDGI